MTTQRSFNRHRTASLTLAAAVAAVLAGPRGPDGCGVVRLLIVIHQYLRCCGLPVGVDGATRALREKASYASA